jgi:hypothetical protein
MPAACGTLHGCSAWRWWQLPFGRADCGALWGPLALGFGGAWSWWQLPFGRADCGALWGPLALGSGGRAPRGLLACLAAVWQGGLRGGSRCLDVGTLSFGAPPARDLMCGGLPARRSAGAVAVAASSSVSDAPVMRFDSAPLASLLFGCCCGRRPPWRPQRGVPGPPAGVSLPPSLPFACFHRCSPAASVSGCL